MRASKRRHLPPLWVLLAALLVCSRSPAQDGPSEDLGASVTEIAAAHHGHVALYAAQLDAGGTALPGRSLAVDADREVQTASDIKLAILYHAMAEVRAGRARWDETLILRKGEPVGGSGVLHFFDTPLTLTLKDVLTMMVIVSDNTAANLAIDRFGVGSVNARLQSLGLVHTFLYKKVMKPATGPMPADQPKFGLGKTTPHEMATLMSDIAMCRLRQDAAEKADQVRALAIATLQPMDTADKAVCDVAFTMLENQFYRETIPRFLPNGGDGAVLSKTGSLDAVRNDVAVVAGKSGPIVLAIFTYGNADHGWTVDNEGELTVAKLAKAIVEAWSPGGLNPSILHPGLAAAAGGAAH